jgi:hypothetical protein
MSYSDDDDGYAPRPSAAQQAAATVGVFGIAAASACFVWTESGPARWLIAPQQALLGGYYPKATWLFLTLLGVVALVGGGLLVQRLGKRRA